MRLLTKTSLLYILLAVPVLALCSLLCYYLVYSEVKDNIDESMWKDMLRMEKQLAKKDTLAGFSSVLDSDITIRYAGDSLRNSPLRYSPSLSDTSLYDAYEEEVIPFRILKRVFVTDKHVYLATIKRTYLESDDLVNSILTAIVIMFVCLLAGFFLINFFLSKKLWKPFYRTLELLQEYELDKGNSIVFTPTRTKEFTALNAALGKMTAKIYNDFMNQKQFAENASHEMQTPLAVIKNKIELLIQSKTLSAADMETIQAIYHSANKLSQINKALLLLSKIESSQFAEVKEINKAALLERMLNNFSDMIAMKQISVEKRMEPGFLATMNPYLAEVLVSNLLQNAIRHNIQGGKITIRLNEGTLLISNTGHEFKGDPREMFSRFRKSDQSSESIGLGMAIIKQVCDYYGFGVAYTVEGTTHAVTIRFR